MSTILWKKLHLCFSSSSSLMQPSSPQSTLSLSSKPDNHGPPSHTPSFFINNFNFLYDHLSSPRHHRSNTFTTTTDSNEGDNHSHPVGFAAVFAHRRFLSSPQETGSADYRTAVSQLISGGVAVMKQVESPDPYRDFRRSMEEMVELRGDREFLHELLFCYLSLNPKHTHKFIITAFADTLVSLSSH